MLHLLTKPIAFQRRTLCRCLPSRVWQGRIVAVFAVVLAQIASLLGSGAAAAEANDRPNLIYIMVDDLGYGDLGCFGQQTIQTPNIDQLAAEGMKLTSHYSGNTVCRPSRLSLWTGMHAGHTAIDSNAPYVLKPDDVTVGELLQQAGYVTGGVGKWALGDTTNSGHPNRQGFDFWMGYLDQSEAHNYYPEKLWRNQQKVPLPGNVLSDDPVARGRVSVTRTTYSHDVMTDEMLDFVRGQTDKPFLLHVHWTIPHANNEGGRLLKDGMEVPDYGIYADRDWPNPEKGFAAMITRMDGDVGRLMTLLKEKGIDDKTMVFFTSDNGPHSEGNHKHEYFDSNGPLRGYKRDLYEGGIRMPTIARWPGKIAAGSTSDHLLAHYDWLATACELAGVAVPKQTDGISFVPTLLGKPQQAHEYLFWSYGEKKAVRMGKWKGVISKKNKPLELYELDNDIGEMNDVAGQHAEIVKKLQAAIDAAQS